MKKIIIIILSAYLCLNLINQKTNNNIISNLITKLYSNKDYYIITNQDALKINKYSNENSFFNFSQTNNFKPRNKDELLNVYYTILNNGWDNFSFYCDESYNNCLEDVQSFMDNKVLFNFNQIVHPFNSYESIESNYNNKGRIDIKVNKKYNDTEVELINKKLNQIITNLNLNSYNDIKMKIKIFHDYIANTNKYDLSGLNKNITYHSDSAIGTLFEGKSICSGYTDTMAIFLSMLNIENLRIATKDHIWNIVKLNNNWYHIDLTWDDPIVSDGKNIIIYDYFLITTNELDNKNDNKHNFDKNFYNFLY